MFVRLSDCQGGSFQSFSSQVPAKRPRRKVKRDLLVTYKTYLTLASPPPKSPKPSRGPPWPYLRNV